MEKHSLQRSPSCKEIFLNIRKTWRHSVRENLGYSKLKVRPINLDCQGYEEVIDLGIEMGIYDNDFDQPIDSGNIIVHKDE